MKKTNSLKQSFLDLVNTLNKQPASQEYIIYGGIESRKQMDEAVKELMWRSKNPVLDQPAQKWHYGDGFYMVLKPFGHAKAGDIILLKNYVHTRVVKIATATERQIFFDWSEDFKADMKFTPAEWKSLRPLEKWELLKIFPHLSERIKHLHAYFAVMQYYPEYICEDCMSLLNLEVKGGGWQNHHYMKTCCNCKKRPVKVYFRNALKPIDL